MACEIWLRRDYLLRHNIQPDEPACDCCDETPAVSVEAAAETARRMGDRSD